VDYLSSWYTVGEDKKINWGDVGKASKARSAALHELLKL